MTLLEGAVIFVDDEVEKLGTDANNLLKEIESTGRPTARYGGIPVPEHVPHWEGVSFVVVDWNLKDRISVPGSSTLSEEADEEVLEFIATVSATYYCPIFVVSSQPSAAIQRQLEESSDPRIMEALPERIKVFRKDAVLSSFVDSLEAWVEGNLALRALRAWDKEYQKAKSRLFADLGKYAESWPAYVTAASDGDKTDPSVELADVIHANLRSRIDPVAFDELIALAGSASPSTAGLKEVHYGRSVLPANRVPDSTIFPGDIFESWRLEDPEGSLWINITPACHTVRKRHPSSRALKLHLIRGVPIEIKGTEKQIESALKQFAGNPNVQIVHALRDGAAYKFEFKHMRIASWETVKRHRYGRLLPPFITSLQQRHGAFLTTEGLPRVLPSFYL
jgi:hypothetical protein